MESSDNALLPDVRHVNGFYTIADTLHKENANSAVTVTTQSQMGEVRMSSRVAESLNFKQGHIQGLDLQSELDQRTFNSDIQLLAQPPIDNDFNPLQELTECVDHINLLDDFNSKEDVCGTSSGQQQMSQVGNSSAFCLSTNTGLLPSSDSKQLIDQSVGLTRSLDNKEKEEIPASISEFVLGHDRGLSHLALQVPINDSDLDRILPTGFDNAIELVQYESELQMPDIMRLITKDLSEPYSIYTYRYFIHNWPSLCFLAMHGSLCVGAIVCKLDVHKKVIRRGYIAMLAVDENYRKKNIGSSLVRKAIRAMIRGECDEVVLETEITNKPALRLYENLGFSRDKRLFRYYLNGVDALRLKLWLR